MVEGKVSQLEKMHGKNNVLIFGLEEWKEEGYFNTLYMMKFLKDLLKLKVLIGSNDYVSRLGRRREQ